MTYDLAKQLKDAGFPQNPNIPEQAESIENGHPKLPTLSQLIEACEQLKGYELFDLEHPEMGWFATMLDQQLSEPLEPEYISGGYCSTPEEAVAKLWLSLNKS